MRHSSVKSKGETHASLFRRPHRRRGARFRGRARDGPAHDRHPGGNGRRPDGRRAAGRRPCCLRARRSWARRTWPPTTRASTASRRCPPAPTRSPSRCPGFGTLKREGVRLRVGSHGRGERLPEALARLAEEVTVIGEATVVDTTDQPGQHQLRQGLGAQRPRPALHVLRPDQRRARRQPPADRRLALHLAGLRTTDNSYLLDGTDFTAPLTGAAWPWPNTDAIEEIEVLSLGAPAEYGNMQGAVFNVVTRQGSQRVPRRRQLLLPERRPHRRATPRRSRTTACPIHRDKYNDAHRPAQRPHHQGQALVLRLLPVPAGLPVARGVPPEFPNKFEADRVFGKLNWQLSSQAQADVRLPRRLLPDPLRRQRLQRLHRPQHDQGRDTATTRRPT